MEFEEYNGWPNFPTWDVFTVMTSYYETYQELERVQIAFRFLLLVRQ